MEHSNRCNEIQMLISSTEEFLSFFYHVENGAPAYEIILFWNKDNILKPNHSPSSSLMPMATSNHTGDFPRGVGHRVENGRGLTKVAVVLLNGLIW